MYSTATKTRASEEIGGQQPMLPQNVIVGALRYAQMIEGTAHEIPNDRVMTQLYEELGWS